MPNLIVQTLEKQVGCYQRLAKLAEIQHRHIQLGQTDELLSILGQRQQELTILSELESGLGEIKQRWTKYLTELPNADRDRADTLLAETRRLLELITTIDRQDSQVLQQRKLSVGRSRDPVATSQASRGYAAAAYGMHRK